MTKTAKMVTLAATRILKSRKASKAEKAVAATALTQTKSAKETTPRSVSSSAAKVLKNPRASREAKSVAASALTHKPPLWKRDGSIMGPDYASIDVHNQATGEWVTVQSNSPIRAELICDCILKALNQ